MITGLISVLQGKGQGFEEYTKELEDIIRKVYENNKKEKMLPAVLHQTAASDGRIHTTIQINVL